jgi:transposase InsO family protein
MQLPPLEGYDAIYVIADQLTKMVHFIPCKSTFTLEQLVELHIHHVWPLHGLPLHHNTDCSPQFTAPYMRELYWNLGIDQRLSTAYHPKPQGQVESNNKWLETYLRMFSTYRQGDWAAFIHTAKFAYNNHFHPLIGMSPFYVNYGYHLVYTD